MKEKLQLIEALEEIISSKSMSLALEEHRHGLTLEEKIKEIIYETLLEILRELKEEYKKEK